MLSILGLTTVYPGPVPVLQGIDLGIPAGVFGLLEPNGPRRPDRGPRGARASRPLPEPAVGTANAAMDVRGA